VVRSGGIALREEARCGVQEGAFFLVNALIYLRNLLRVQVCLFHFKDMD
jgi:hypothetical protein